MAASADLHVAVSAEFYLSRVLSGSNVRASLLDRVPIDTDLEVFFRSTHHALGTCSRDLVISRSSGWAHSVRTAEDTFHAVYCYTPARWLYGSEHLGASLLKPIIGPMRSWDRATARRATITNMARRFSAQTFRECLLSVLQAQA